MFAWMRWLPVIGRLSLESRSLECQFKLLNDQHPKPVAFVSSFCFVVTSTIITTPPLNSKPQINFDCDSQ